ncbi:ABC transporter ATP-binding protein YtrB [Pseudobythopirellula maris]|uniref:ABC transporter ATP-binding protein YtrB n=1 Tax=Pseudobythopirellula maris TaxID=2527991 RepID=A0A5C5ZL55_9BACT|nr:ABC transporter ATP-binding protein [Pseudobythopirellula maris]TWT88129.1 ABC transporter ATP-binding protein YtrB [Pseudobythopirellula maris]
MNAIATEPPLQAVRLGKSFGEKVVLHDASLLLEPGQVLGLLGKNGSGKSTLIKCLLGLLRTTAGEARVFGEDAWDLSAGAKARLGYVPQQVTAYPWMRVRQMIAYTAAFYTGWNHALADDLCRRWDLPLEDRTGVLSVGQLQTLGLVLALGHEPDLLVLDEPVASLDPSARREFLRTLIDIAVESDESGPQRSVLFSTHITSDLERIANRVAVLQNGRVAFDSELDTLKESVKRLRLTSHNGAIPDGFAVPGALSTHVAGSLATVTVADYQPETANELASRWDADVAVDDLNLEEIFLEMHDGLSH